MNLQDRVYAAIILVIMGFCCIGAYVAVSGFMNANPNGLSFGLGASTPEPSVQSATVVVATEAATASASAAASSRAVARATSTPKGTKATLTPVSRGTPSPSFLSDIPSVTPPPTGNAPSPTPLLTGCGAPFCPKTGPADPSVGPSGQACPSNFLWGIVYDKNGQGLAGMTIRYRDPQGEGKDISTKGPPDPPGKYDIPTTGGGGWTIQLVDGGGNALSPVFRVQARQVYNGGKMCPMRIDFVQS